MGPFRRSRAVRTSAGLDRPKAVPGRCRRWVAHRPPEWTMVDLATLASWTRAQLIEKASELGVERPERMTRLELRDEIQRLTRPRGGDRPKGLLGTARSMLASMVEAGLNMPEAAAVIRGESGFDVRVKAQVPVATVTLAEIYAVQGHRERALRMLDDVLAAEPDHEVARELRQRLEQEGTQKPAEEPRTSELVETTGEEIRTGKPPEVAPVMSPAPEPVATAPEADTTQADAGATPSEAEAARPDASATATKAAQPEASATTPEADTGAPAAHEPPAPEADEPPTPEADEAQAEPDATEAEPDATQADEAQAEPDATASEADEEQPEAPPSETSPPPKSAEAERDALFFRTDETSTRLYWELTAASVDGSSRRMPDGRAVIRVVAVHPDPGGARRDQRDLAVEDPVGVREVDFRSPAVIRAALGWLAPEGFHPLVIATDLDGDSLPPEAPALKRARARLDGDDGAAGS